MGKRRWTHEEFVKELKKVQPDLEVVSKFENYNTKIKIRDEYGELLSRPDHLIEGKTPSIRSAINKTYYFINKLNKETSLLSDIKIIGEYINSAKKIKVKNDFGELLVTPTSLLNNNEPTINSAINKTDYFINQAKEIHGDKYDYSKVEYKASDKKVCIICPEHGEFWQKPNNHISRGNGCSKCNISKAKLKFKNTKEFVSILKSMYKNQYDYSKVKYKGLEEDVVLKNQYGWVKTKPYNLIEKRVPSLRHAINKTEYFIKISKKIHDDKYDYSKSKYINSLKDIEIICPNHGNFWQNPNAHLLGNGCPKCRNNSIGELKVEKVLQYNDILYKKEYMFDNCINKSYLRFDFYLPKHNICIEYDGRQHYEAVDFAGKGEEWAKNQLKKTQQNDQIKNDYCKENNIKLIRIPYWDFDNIEEILERKIGGKDE